VPLHRLHQISRGGTCRSFNWGSSDTPSKCARRSASTDRPARSSDSPRTTRWMARGHGLDGAVTAHRAGGLAARVVDIGRQINLRDIVDAERVISVRQELRPSISAIVGNTQMRLAPDAVLVIGGTAVGAPQPVTPPSTRRRRTAGSVLDSSRAPASRYGRACRCRAGRPMPKPQSKVWRTDPCRARCEKSCTSGAVVS
jgi:hypothetical protein